MGKNVKDSKKVKNQKLVWQKKKKKKDKILGGRFELQAWHAPCSDPWEFES